MASVGDAWEISEREVHGCSDVPGVEKRVVKRVSEWEKRVEKRVSEGYTDAVTYLA